MFVPTIFYLVEERRKKFSKNRRCESHSEDNKKVEWLKGKRGETFLTLRETMLMLRRVPKLSKKGYNGIGVGVGSLGSVGSWGSWGSWGSLGGRNNSMQKNGGRNLDGASFRFR